MIKLTDDQKSMILDFVQECLDDGVKENRIPYEMQGFLRSMGNQSNAVELRELATDPNAIAKLLSEIKESKKNPNPDRTDSARQLITLPNGLTAGITHFPGDNRFSGGRPMTAKYGHIRNLPKGPDKKAHDIYLGDTPDSPHLFKVQQRNPETMLPDEIKWMAHYPDLASARNSYCYHCGVNRLGYILPARWDELSPPNP